MPFLVVTVATPKVVDGLGRRKDDDDDGMIKATERKKKAEILFLNSNRIFPYSIKILRIFFLFFFFFFLSFLVK